MRHSHIKFIEKDREKLRNILLAKHLHQHEKEFQQKASLYDNYTSLTRNKCYLFYVIFDFGWFIKLMTYNYRASYPEKKMHLQNKILEVNLQVNKKSHFHEFSTCIIKIHAKFIIFLRFWIFNRFSTKLI